MTDDLRCDLVVAARSACADIIGAAHLLYYSYRDTPYEIARIHAALAKITSAVNAAYPVREGDE